MGIIGTLDLNSIVFYNFTSVFPSSVGGVRIDSLPDVSASNVDFCF